MSETPVPWSPDAPLEGPKRLVLVGDSAFAEIAFEYFSHDSPYEVVAFAVEREFLTKSELFGLPIHPLEELEDHCAPQEHSFHAALAYTQRNQLRTRLFEETRARGYCPASYISSRSFIWRNVELGEHCFIFEDNTIQPFVKVGNNVVMWSGNHIGHHSTIEDNCFIASHAVMSGFTRLGESSFLGVNATFSNNIEIASDCVVGAGALVLADVPPGTTVRGIWKRSRE